MADDYPEAVIWLFASLEATVMALAESHGVAVQPKHHRKVEVAAQLHADGRVPTDLAPALRMLNHARKQAIYDGDEPDLGAWSLQTLADEVEQAVELAEGGLI